MMTIFAIDLLVVLITAIAWGHALDRDDARRASVRAGLPVIGTDVSVPRAIAVPTARRRDPLRWP